MAENTDKEFLCHFCHYHLGFRLPELDSLATIFNIPLRYNRTAFDEAHPFLMVQIPSEDDAKKLASRAILIKGFFEVWATGTNYTELLEDLAKFPLAKMHHYIHPEKTFRIDVEAFGKNYTLEEKIQKMALFSHLPWGKANLKHPDHVFWILEDFGKQAEPGIGPRRVWFARQIALGSRHLIHQYSLKRRVYLGTTSMTAELSLLMANQALARPNTLVLDPFVGTGSLLIACAHFGATVIGGDIDVRVLTGRSEQESVRGNFRQYGLQLADLVRCDQSQRPFRTCPLFDAIVCDPPYGIRAGARKIGRRIDACGEPLPTQAERRAAKRTEANHERGANQQPIGTEQQRWTGGHGFSSIAYDVPDVLIDLLRFSAEMLKVGGRLVYWLPTTNEYRDSDLPTHPCFVLVANSEQPITTNWRRRLITMEKTMEYNPDVHILHPSALQTAYIVGSSCTTLGEEHQEPTGERRVEVAHANFRAKVLPSSSRRQEKKAAKRKRHLEKKQEKKKIIEIRHEGPK